MISDLTGVRYSVIIYFFHRYIVYIANRNYTEIRKELEKSCANPLIKGVFYDKKYLLKGKKMKLFNWLVLHDMYSVLALLCKTDGSDIYEIRAFVCFRIQINLIKET